MIKRDIKEIHELLMQNVREENEKENKELLNPVFNLSSKNNLISVAKETLKPKNYKKYNIKDKLIPVKITKPIGKNSSKISPKRDKFRKNITFSDKEYLSFMMNDLKVISSSIKRKQNKFNPIYSHNNSILQNLKKENKNNKYNSCGVTKKNNNRIFNLKMNSNNAKMQNYNIVNLLSQVTGDKEYNDDCKYENNITENNNYFNNLCYDNDEKKFYVEENLNNFC